MDDRASKRSSVSLATADLMAERMAAELHVSPLQADARERIASILEGWLQKSIRCAIEPEQRDNERLRREVERLTRENDRMRIKIQSLLRHE